MTLNDFANSPLVSQITFKTNNTTRMTTTKQYDLLNRLSSISSLNSQPATINSFTYSYNIANQRTQRAEADASYWVYLYDSLGQVVSGKKYFSDGTPVPGQQFEYAHDDIGNRASTKAGGNAVGSGLRSAAYSANTLNQYTSRDVPNAFDVLGASHATNSVTVNGSAADYRRGEYFQELVSVVNSATSVWQRVAVTNSGAGWTTGNVFVAKTPEAFTYDLDGNLTQDGRWTYTWDAENRLTQAESLSSSPAASRRKVVWEYDAKGRRIRQTTSDKSSGSYVVTEDLKLLYDGWACVAELNYADNALKRSYVWGTDLSGTMTGAGGVGGLLMINSVANGAHFYAMDGNGNVTALVKASDGTVSANYEYDPFGQSVRATGPMANENRFDFSTKRTDRTTDLVLYEYRIYCPFIGRWLNRDPIADEAFLKFYSQNRPIQFSTFLRLKSLAPVYVFIGNNPENLRDIHGLWQSDEALNCKAERCKPKPPCKLDPTFKYDDSPFVFYDADIDDYINNMESAWNSAPTPPGATADKWRHCMFICRTARNHRPLEAIAAALVSEFPFVGGGHSSINDFWANLQGLYCDIFSRETCSKSCACATQGAPYD